MSNFFVTFEDRNGILLFEACAAGIAWSGCCRGLEFGVRIAVVLDSRSEELVEIGLLEGLLIGSLASQWLLMVEIVNALVLLWLL